MSYKPDFGQFKSVYGLNLLSAFQSSANPVTTLPLQILEDMHETMLLEMAADGRLPEEFGISHGATSYNKDQLLELMNENREALRLHVVRTFEEYFRKNTDGSTLIADYQRGDAQARQIFAYASVFPVEAAAVRSEFHYPAYMRHMAQSGRIALYLAMRFKDANGQTLANLALMQGPLQPRLEDEKMIDVIKSWPEMDYLLAHSEPADDIPAVYN